MKLSKTSFLRNCISGWNVRWNLQGLINCFFINIFVCKKDALIPLQMSTLLSQLVTANCGSVSYGNYKGVNTFTTQNKSI